MSNNFGMNPQDRITHLLASWPKTSSVGQDMRLEQIEPEYQALEQQRDYEQCWVILLGVLKKWAMKPAQALRHAQKLWDDLRWAGHIRNTISHIRRAVGQCRRYNVPKLDYEIVLRFLKCIPSESAV